MDNKELIALGSPYAAKPLVVGGHVYDPLTFAPEVVKFSRNQYIFLNAFKLGVPLEEAAAKANLTPDQAERFLDKPQTIAWLKDRSMMSYIKNEWEEPGKWWSLGNDVLEGTREFSKAQTVVFQEFGNRICPKVKDLGDEKGRTVINFNFSQEAVQEAFRRQQVIEGELAKEQNGD